MTSLHISGLTAGYRGTPVLSGVDLTVPCGGFAAVLGPSGCGKTTLLRVVAGFHRPDAGEVRLGDVLVAGGGMDVPPERRRVGIVPQEGALFPHLTVGANVGYGLSKKMRRSGRVAEMLDVVGLADHQRKMPHQLSGGQQQRVALARALAPEPELVLLDEPFNALDAGLRAEVRADVRAALRSAGATAVLVTHDQEEALAMADVVAVLRDGAIAQVAPPQQVYGEPSDLDVALFVGAAVVFDVHAAGGVADTPLGRVALAGNGHPAAGNGVAVLRPEQLRLRPAARSEATAVVRDVLFHGHDATVELDLVRSDDPVPATGVTARVQGAVNVTAGDPVNVTVDGRARFFPPRAG